MKETFLVKNICYYSKCSCGKENFSKNKNITCSCGLTSIGRKAIQIEDDNYEDLTKAENIKLVNTSIKIRRN